MPVEVLVMFFGGLAGIGGIILAGQWIQAKGGASDGVVDEMTHLAETLDSLREEVRVLQDEVVELDERLQLTERLLPPAKTEHSHAVDRRGGDE